MGLLDALEHKILAMLDDLVQCIGSPRASLSPSEAEVARLRGLLTAADGNAIELEKKLLDLERQLGDKDGCVEQLQAAIPPPFSEPNSMPIVMPAPEVDNSLEIAS